MPLNPSTFQTRTPLDSYSIAVSNDLDGYIALKIMPELLVSKSSGSFYQMSKDDLRLEDLTAPTGTEAAAGDYSAFTSSYDTKEKAHKYLVKSRDAENFDVAVADLNRMAARRNMEKLLGDLEDAVHTKCTTSSNYPAAQVLTLSAGDTWADPTSSPIDDVRSVRQAVFEACGKYPNVMGLQKKTGDYLRIHPEMRELTKYTMKGPIPLDLVAATMDLERIEQSYALKNTGNKGAADALSTIWDDDAVLAYVNPSTGLETMTYGRTILRKSFYTKEIDAPELARGGSVHWLESGWEFTPEFIARVSSADGDSIAGGVIINCF